MSDIIPFRDKILVKKIEDDSKTRSGLTIPDGSVERPTKGEILAVGEGRMTEEGKIIPMPFKVGDKILYPKYSGFPVKIDTEEFLILKEDEVLGFLK